MSNSIHIRTFTDADVPLGMELKALARWNQVEADWRRFLAMQPDGCFVAEIDGHPAGTATTIAYGQRFGWVGMVLVHPERRRRGIGSALLEHCIAHLEGRGVACVKLDATPLGKKLYDTLGFVDELHIERRQIGSVADLPPAEACVSRMLREDLSDVADYDAPIFGAPRRRPLELLFRQNPSGCFVSRDGAGRVCGYIFSRAGAHAWQVGPWSADRRPIAAALLHAALDPLRGGPVFMDVPLLPEGPREIVSALGFEVQRPLIRMYKGDNRCPGDASRAYAFCGPETG